MPQYWDPIYPDFQGFGHIYVLVQAIQKAGSDDPEKIRQALLNNEFDYWVGKVRFRQVAGPGWQHVTVPTLHIAQWTAPRQKLSDAPILYPKEADMKRRTVLAVVVAVIVIAAAAFFAFTTLSRPAEPIKIGLLTPLSPPGDPGAGTRIRRGAEIAVEIFNEQGGVLGRKIELIVEDDAGTPEKGVAGARKLITSDKVVAIGGQFHSSVALQVQEVCEEFRIICMFPHPSAAAITEKGRTWTFRIHVTDLDRSDILIRWAKEKGFKRVAAVAENTDFGLGYIKNLKDKMKEYQYSPEFFEIVFDRTTKDLTPELLKVKDFNPDPDSTAVIAKNVPSRKYCRKDLVKIEGEYITSTLVNIIGVYRCNPVRNCW
jgi:ABC-type branched-subunit amino acid transport system substrate-binding protein